MAQQNSNKGNPAMKRMQNKALKAKRERCYYNSIARKKANREANEARAAANRERRANGIPTPWEEAEAKRKAERAERFANRNP